MHEQSSKFMQFTILKFHYGELKLMLILLKIWIIGIIKKFQAESSVLNSTKLSWNFIFKQIQYCHFLFACISLQSIKPAFPRNHHTSESHRDVICERPSVEWNFPKSSCVATQRWIILRTHMTVGFWNDEYSIDNNFSRTSPTLVFQWWSVEHTCVVLRNSCQLWIIPQREEVNFVVVLRVTRSMKATHMLADP